jgi:hypothetical protein
MTRVVLNPDRHGRYHVTLDGEEIVWASRDPEHDAARALLARGFTGPFETVGEDGVVRMRFRDVAETAKWSIVEESRDGLRRRLWSGPHNPDTAPPAGETPSEASESRPPVVPLHGDTVPDFQEVA